MKYDGYIGEEYDELKKEVSDKYDDCFRLCKKISEFINHLRLEIGVKRDDIPGTIIIPLFTKSLETYQSIFILLTHCLISPAASLLRVLLEDVIIIGYCCKGNTEFERYMARELHKKKKLINIIMQSLNIFPKEEIDEEKIQNNLTFIKKKLEEIGNPSKISTEEMAKKIGLERHYATVYRTVSNEVHTNPYILDRYLDFDENDVVVAFSSNPNTDETPKYLLQAMELIMIECLILSDYFDFPKKKDVEMYYEEVKKLVEKY